MAKPPDYLLMENVKGFETSHTRYCMRHLVRGEQEKLTGECRGGVGLESNVVREKWDLNLKYSKYIAHFHSFP